MGSTLDEARAKLAAHFAGDGAAKGDRWEALWKDSEFLPWDRGIPSPALSDLLSDRQDLIQTAQVRGDAGTTQRKSALVPGCGRGYDVLLLSSFGYDSYGLEVSESAIEKCFEEREKHGKNYPVKDTSTGAGKTDFISGNFFESGWLSRVGTHKFDLIYDYTFLCALPPGMRPQWARQMSRILAEDGALICLEFPSKKDPKLAGPPWALPPEVYLAHLSHPGEDISYGEDGYVKDVSDQSRSPGALERFAHFQPTRTHEIGQGQDWISVWRHISG